MNAKELRDLFRSGDSYLVTSYRGEAGSIKEADNLILRALDMLAATEGSEDAIVRELRDEADLCRNETATDIADLLDDAASCIVAMGSQFVALKAERDELKRHAEAMAAVIDREVGYDSQSVFLYRVSQENKP